MMLLGKIISIHRTYRKCEISKPRVKVARERLKNFEGALFYLFENYFEGRFKNATFWSNFK